MLVTSLLWKTSLLRSHLYLDDKDVLLHQIPNHEAVIDDVLGDDAA